MADLGGSSARRLSMNSLSIRLARTRSHPEQAVLVEGVAVCWAHGEASSVDPGSPGIIRGLNRLALFARLI